MRGAVFEVCVLEHSVSGAGDTRVWTASLRCFVKLTSILTPQCRLIINLNYISISAHFFFSSLTTKYLYRAPGCVLRQSQDANRKLRK